MVAVSTWVPSVFCGMVESAGIVAEITVLAVFDWDTDCTTWPLRATNGAAPTFSSAER